MAQKMTNSVKKIILALVALVIASGAFYLNRMTQMPEEAPNAVSSDECETAETGHGDATFLNYDMVIGDKCAPVEIIEYAAISCPHCAHFHEEVLPELKTKFLDTGKAKLVYRNFIFDNPFDVFASTLTRCVSEEEFFPTLQTYFDHQEDWNQVQELRRIFNEAEKADEGRAAAIKFAKAEVAKIGQMAGLSDQDSQKCFDNPEVVNYLLEIRKTAMTSYNVASTPTLIVGGKKLESNDIESIAEAIAAAAQ